MTTEPIELESVWWPGPDGDLRTGGKWGVERIVLKNAGHGPMGHYDIIEIHHEDGKVSQSPAHHAEGWRLKEKTEATT